MDEFVHGFIANKIGCKALLSLASTLSLLFVMRAGMSWGGVSRWEINDERTVEVKAGDLR